MFLRKLFGLKKNRTNTKTNNLLEVQAMIADRAPDARPAYIEIMKKSVSTRFRMLNAGISRYKWSTANDEKVCDCCSRRANKTFDIDSSADSLYPGEFICEHGQLCRCVMVPLIKGVDY